jgi:hypothetical protein
MTCSGMHIGFSRANDAFLTADCRRATQTSKVVLFLGQQGAPRGVKGLGVPAWQAPGPLIVHLGLQDPDSPPNAPVGR